MLVSVLVLPRPIWLAETETYKTFRVENGLEDMAKSISAGK